MLKQVVIPALLVVWISGPTFGLHPLSDSFIHHINSKQQTWKAGRNFPINTPLRNLVGAHPRPVNTSLPIMKYEASLTENLPENFDAREKWPYCPSLREIRDQGSCGSCYAFGAVEAMTDRVCIHSAGKKQFHFSAEDVVSCCQDCGDCRGGNPDDVWIYWNEVGIVSGGNYDSDEGCKPYSFPSCKTVPHPPPHPTGFNNTDKLQLCFKYDPKKTPTCSKTCKDSRSYESDKMKGLKPYIIMGEDNMKAELFLNGPIEVTFLVYEDFFNYKSGVYVHVDGNLVYGHAVKLIGWGVEDGVKYWLLANSWNESWGDKGFFKIHREENFLGIGNWANGALPDFQDKL